MSKTPLNEDVRNMKYNGQVVVDGEVVSTASGTMQQMANWADNVIRVYGSCEIKIEQEKEKNK